MRRCSLFLVAVTISSVVLAPAWVSAQQPQTEPDRYAYGQHMRMMDWDGGWYGMILGPLFMILVLAVPIALAVILARGLGGPWHGTPPSYHPHSGSTALEVLKKRYARGEIDKAEFEERRRVLDE